MIKKVLIAGGVSVMLSGCPLRMPRGPRISLGPSIDLGPRITVPSGGKMVSETSRQMYNYKFAPGGIWIWHKGFETGEWTRWDVYSDNKKELETELAYLGSFSENRKWWQIKYTSQKDKSHAVFEALVDHSDFSFRRLRAKVGDEEIQELPVTEGSFLSVEPGKLTPESIEAATVGEERLDLPAGVFTALRVQYSGLEAEKIDLWLKDEVPGGVVRYSLSGKEGEIIFELNDYGTGAETVLDSY